MSLQTRFIARFAINNSARVSSHPRDAPKLFRHFPRQFVTCCKSLLLSRETRRSLSSPPLCQNSPFPPDFLSFATLATLSFARFPPRFHRFSPPSRPLTPLLPSPSFRPSRLTFLTKSKITFVTRNSVRNPNPRIELTLSFLFLVLLPLYSFRRASFSFSQARRRAETYR